MEGLLTWNERNPGARLVDLDPGPVGDLVDEAHEACFELLQPRVLVPVPDLGDGHRPPAEHGQHEAQPEEVGALELKGRAPLTNGGKERGGRGRHRTQFAPIFFTSVRTARTRERSLLFVFLFTSRRSGRRPGKTSDFGTLPVGFTKPQYLNVFFRIDNPCTGLMLWV